MASNKFLAIASFSLQKLWDQKRTQEEKRRRQILGLFFGSQWPLEEKVNGCEHSIVGVILNNWILKISVERRGTKKKRS
jgi:hypothetical protein